MAYQMNLRELIYSRSRTAKDLYESLGCTKNFFTFHMLNRGRATAGEAQTIARELGCSLEMVLAALRESETRPGGDARGRGRKSSDARASA